MNASNDTVGFIELLMLMWITLRRNQTISSNDILVNKTNAVDILSDQTAHPIPAASWCYGIGGLK